MAARIYVGTYAKYNAGSIKGAWLDVEDYSDKDEFLKACADLHSDESDPEFMFQDFEGFPKGFYSESYIKPELFDWLALDESDRELLAVYQEHVAQDGDIDAAREAYAGTFDSPEAWARNFLDDTGALQSVPENLRNYIDYESYARDAQYGGDPYFAHHEGDVFVFWSR